MTMKENDGSSRDREVLEPKLAVMQRDEIIGELLERLHQALIAEAASSARAAQRLDHEARRIAQDTLPLEALERALAKLPREIADLGEAPVGGDGGRVEPGALLLWTAKAIELRASAWAELSQAVEDLTDSALARASELEINRLRLLDSLRENSRRRTDAATAAARIVLLEHAVARVETELRERDRVLAQFGHQFVSRLGAILDPYPGVRWVITAPLRLVHWILGRGRA